MLTNHQPPYPPREPLSPHPQSPRDAGFGGQAALLPMADLSNQDVWPGVPNRCKVVIAETFSQSGKSFAVTPLNSMSVRSRRTF
jgi:hypothetical protein